MDHSLADRQQELITGLAGELATVISALLGSNAAAVAGNEAPPAGWTVACSLTGTLSGRIVLAVGDSDATALARRLMGMDEDPAQDAVLDTLGEVVGQAVGGLGQQPVAVGAKIRIEGAAVHGGSRPSAPPSIFDVAMEDGTSLRFAAWALLEASDQLAATPPLAQPAVPGLSPGGASSAQRPPAPAVPTNVDNLEVILDIELPLTVRFGRTEMTLQALTHVGPGSVIDLDRSPDEPVDVLINDKVIARGEVVVVAGNYGVRVTEVISAADRIRTLGS
jgi:flagellar motor switch protein FliN/FliY